MSTVAPSSGGSGPVPPKVPAPTSTPPVAYAPPSASGSPAPLPEGLLDTAIPHACEPETLPDPERPSAIRLIGIDVARTLALVGMIAVHILPNVTDDGTITWPFLLASGKSAALFAVLAGVGIAFSTGRDRVPRGRRWGAAVASVAVRAVLITLIGLALGMVITANTGHVILVSYGVMFLLAIPLLRLRPLLLSLIALALATGMPILSHVLRQDLPVVEPDNPSFGTLVAFPSASVTEILLTGTFPALSWLAYVCAGMAIGRSALALRIVTIRMVTIGTIVAVTSSAVSWFLLFRMGGLPHLVAAATPIMSREDFADTFVWGATGTLPTNSPWWLTVLAPHTTTPFDLLFTMGIAVAVLGVCLILAFVYPHVVRPIGRFGSMPLSIYAAHLLLLLIPYLNEDGGIAAFFGQLLILGLFAFVWTRFFRRGPLETVLWWVARATTRLVERRPAATREPASP